MEIEYLHRFYFPPIFLHPFQVIDLRCFPAGKKVQEPSLIYHSPREPARRDEDQIRTEYWIRRTIPYQIWRSTTML